MKNDMTYEAVVSKIASKMSENPCLTDFGSPASLF